MSITVTQVMLINDLMQEIDNQRNIDNLDAYIAVKMWKRLNENQNTTKLNESDKTGILTYLMTNEVDY